jgi:carbonic anhydrase
MSIAFERYVTTKLVPSLSVHDKPEVMLLTCMDYRYAHRIVDVMDQKGLRLKYDMFVLAGASLGGNEGEGTTNKVPPEWRKALVSHIHAARAINHPIKKLVILEHRQCGAYTHFLELDWENVLPKYESDKHLDQVKKLVAYLKTVFSDLEVDAILLTREEDNVLCEHC